MKATKVMKSTKSSVMDKKGYTKAEKADIKSFRSKRQTARGRGWVTL